MSRRRRLSLLPLVVILSAAPAAAGNQNPPGQSPPTNLSAPSLSGTAMQGSQLSASLGSWSGASISYSYSWNRCNSSGAACSVFASGSALNTYVLASADVGSTIRVTVVASNRNGATSSTSAPTVVVAPPPAPAPATPPANTALPTISGTPTAGTTLNASTGTWSGSPTSYAYAWRRCDTLGANCTAISGATGASYTVTSSDVNFTERVVVTATSSAGSASATSAQTAVVQAAPVSTSAPASTALPTISGTPAAGSVLKASTGTWSGSPTSYGYAWRRCDAAGANCSAITGATSSSYTLTSSDVNFTERVVVTATNSVGSAGATSAQTAVVQAASAPAPAPATSLSSFGASSGWQLPWLSATDRNAYLDSEKAMGVKIVRFDIDWQSIQSGGPTSYNWSAQDAVVQGLNARGIATLGDIAYTPTWARPSTCNTTDKCVPANNSDYGNFCGAAARHYLPMGVHYWEVWNEPNITAFMKPKPDVVKYTGMLKACYTQIKAVDPSATVVTGGTSPAGSYNAPCSTACDNVNGINWLQGIYANGGKGYFDAVGHHPYSFPYAPSTAAGWSAWYQMFGTTPSLRSVMVANGDGDKKIWGTEWGAPTNGPSGSGFVSESTQASQVTEAYTLWKSYTWAGPLMVYTFRDNGTSTTTRENFFGLVRYDLSQKPAYAAYKTAAAAG